MNLRERCEKLFDECMKEHDGDEWKLIESFAREIRNEALAEVLPALERAEQFMVTTALNRARQRGDYEAIQKAIALAASTNTEKVKE